MLGLQIFVSVLFVLALAIISTEKIHRTIVSLLGASILIATGIVTQHQAIASVDFNTLGLLIGMMIIVHIFGQTGFFEYLAIHAVKMTKGRSVKILIVLSILTAVLSAFLDNVTTVLLIIPVTMLVTRILNVSPVPFVLSEIFFSNIGGAATLIGDPPNIIIGSAANLSFVQFLDNMAPLVLILIVIVSFMIKMFFGKEISSKNLSKKALDELDPSKALKNIPLLKKCAGVFIAVLAGFFLHSLVHLEAATIALFGAAVLMLLTTKEPHAVLDKVEWDTLFFFIGLFIMVGALEHSGILNIAATKILEITQGDEMKTSIFMLWFAGIASGFTDNIPITAVLVKLIQDLHATGVDVSAMWWSLAIGADFGGNMTIIGASANIVGCSMLAKNKSSVSFFQFLKYGVPISFVTFIVGTIYVYLVYFA